ncbi:MAG: DNA-3-methyladenine glycosylase family protein [Candidatus Dormibacteraceae bacterium]
MEPQVRTAFPTQRPLDLFSTLVPIGLSPSLKIDHEEVWRATRTPAGPSTIHLRHVAGTVEVEAWGPGAEWAAARAAALCGEQDDASGFRAHHNLIAELYRRHPGLRLTRTDAVFEAFVPAVLGQKVTTIEAEAGYRALVYALGEAAPGPEGLRLPPSAAVLARTPYWAFHRFGVERRRAEVIIRAARSARRLEETIKMDMASAYHRLEAFPGVGPWTAAKVALVALGDADAVPVGDYHLPHAVGYALDGTARSTDERMLELLSPYRGHRARVLHLLTFAGISAPRFGPRQPLRDIINN